MEVVRDGGYSLGVVEQRLQGVVKILQHVW